MNSMDESSIAIVGMAGRFPSAPDPESLWALLREGGDAIRPVPAERWDPGRQLDPDKDVPAVGGFLDDVGLFDSRFFGISPREAADMDPQHRLLLETAWRVLEDAGERAADLVGSATGVYVGASWHDYELLRKELGVRPTQHSQTGVAMDMLAARVSYFLKLRGPSLTVETGCSSALTALHLAVQALRHGDISAAIVGSANLILTPDASTGLTHFGALSPNGRCAAFGSGADGFVRGEAVAAVYLKPLSRAQADGDRIHAVIVRSAMNNDGGGDSLVTPDSAAQEELLNSVYGSGPGAVAPDSVAYIEAHGTGTKAGDPAEAHAIGLAIGQRRSTGPLPIGSVKTNIGHLEAAAGMGGLFKILLALRHRMVPASRHADQPNPEIPLSELNLRLLQEPLQLPRKGPVRLGLSSFGWGGTNVHVVLAAPPAQPPAPSTTGRPSTGLPTLVPLSAQEAAVLGERAAQLRDRMPDDAGLAAFAATLARRRDHFPVRAALLARTPEDLASALAAVAHQSEDGEQTGVVTGRAVPVGRTAFVFPGQGSQWNGMGRQLFAESELFAGVIRRCADALRPYVAWEPLKIFVEACGDEWMDRVDIVQPVLWAMSLGLAELWRATGVEPDVVFGHSQGEIAAATFAGVLSYADGALLVARRSAMLTRASGRGRMLAVDLDRDAALTVAARFPGPVSLAAHNGPTSCVLAGDDHAVRKLKEQLDTEGTYCRLLNVDYASHSPQMAEFREDLLAALRDLRPGTGRAEVLSTVLAAPVEGVRMDAAYWADNLREPVRFADTVSTALDHGVTHLVEISAHPALAPAIEQLIDEQGRSAVALSTLRRGDGGVHHFAAAVGRAYAAGLEPFGDLPHCAPVPLPPYPMRRERHWLPDDQAATHGTRARGLDVHLEASPAEADLWHAIMDVAVTDEPWLRDHRVDGTPVLPCAATIALMIEVAAARTGGRPRALNDVVLRAALAVGERTNRLAVQWRDDLAEGGSLRLSSMPSDAGGWTENATAHAGYRDGEALDVTFPQWVDDVRAAEAEPFYTECASRGLDYGPVFRCVRALYRHADGNAVAGHAVLPPGVHSGPYLLHPVLLDGALQTALALFGEREPGRPLLPTAIRCIRLAVDRTEQPVIEIWAHAVPRPDGTADITVFDGAHRALLTVEGISLTALSDTRPSGGNDVGRLHRLRWLPTGTADASRVSGTWVICGDQDDLAEPLAAALASRTVAVVRCHLDGGSELAGAGADGVVFVAPSADAGLPEQQRGLIRLTALVRACSSMPQPPRLTVVTCEGQSVAPDEPGDPGAALYWGYSRVLRREHSQLEPRIIDVASTDPHWPAACAAEIVGGDGDDQVAVRRQGRFVARLIPVTPGEGEEAGPPPARQTGQPFRIATGGPGDWTALEPQSLRRRAPGPGEIEIEVVAAGLNFIDVMKTLGTYPDSSGEASALGGECVGRVVSVGPGVDGHAPGDRVVACAFGSFASHVTVRADHVQPIPDGLGDAEAAALPLALATAWYGLADLARLQAGQTVLIHSAAGGVGLAAVQIATMLGVRIIATAGNETKRRHLRELGITHVFDSRDPAWARGVRECTRGAGVDVVLNSLTGAAIAAGLDVLAEGGHFVELGKTDIYGGHRLALDAFRKGISFSAVDLAGLMRRRPGRFARLLADIWQHLAAGRLGRLPVRTFSFAEAPDALRQMSRGEHIGKLVLVAPDSVTSVAAMPVVDGRFRPDATYLITGGLGALGLSLAEEFASRGAGALVLLGRSNSGPDARRRIASLRQAGTQVEVAACDVTDAGALRRLLDEIRRVMPPLRGVVHAAGVLADATIATLTPDQLNTVLAPKVFGADLLDALTASDELDMFVLFSSAAALVGNPGQAAYAAANAYLDSKAAYRRWHGRPGLSVQWGPIADMGLAAVDAKRGARLDDRGLPGFPAAEAWLALLRMLERNESVVGYVPFDLDRWFTANPETRTLPSWELMRAAARDGVEGTGGGLVDRLRAAPDGSRAGMIEDTIRSLVGRVLRLHPDRIGRETQFRELGLDSLMSLELRNLLEAELGTRLSPTLLWAHSTVKALAAVLLERITASSA